MNKPTQDEIYRVLDACSEGIAKGSIYPGMGYEEGVRDAIEWLMEGGEPPLGEE